MVEHLDAPKEPVKEPISDGLDYIRAFASTEASVNPAVSRAAAGDSNAPLVSAKLIPPITLIEMRVQTAGDGQRLSQSPADVLNQGDVLLGGKVFKTPDGNQVVTKQDGSTIYKDANNRIFGIRYQNGDMRTFTYNAKGEIDTVLENNRLYTINAAGEVMGTDGKPTGSRLPQVSADGTYIVTDSNRGIHFHYTDRREVVSQNDGSLISKDAQGRTTNIRYADGTNRYFEYDERGRLNCIIDRDGKKYGFVASFDALGMRFGSFKAHDGATISDVSVKPDGTMQYEDQDGKLRTDYSSGNFTKTHLTISELRNTARLLRLTDWTLTTNDSIRETVAKLSSSDRVALDRQYKEMYGESLTDHLKAQRWNPLKRNAIDAILNMLSEASLRDAAAKAFSDPKQLADANKQIDDFRNRTARAGLTPEQIARIQEKAAADLQQNDKSPQGKLEQLDKTLSGGTPTARALAEKYGVTSEEVVRPNGARVRKYYVEGENGVKQPVLETTSDDPREVVVERQLREWRDAKIKEIENKYHFQISRDGQTERLQGKDAALRSPRIDELLALEQAAVRSQPSARAANGKPIRIEFPVTATTPYDAYVAGRASNADQERIVFEPMSRSFKGFKDTALHEFAHIGQHNMRERDAASLDRAYAAMGYRQVRTEGGSTQWQLKGKDGHYYTEHPTSSGTQWIRVDEKGRPMKADGKPASGFADQNAVTVTSTEMQKRAVVKPASWYFTNPAENHAEGLWLLRGGVQDRERLYRTSPDLYRIIKEYDQKEIDADPRYGKNSDGTSKFIRLPDGTIGPNNEANRAGVAQFEAQIINQSAPSRPPAVQPSTFPDRKETRFSSDPGTLPRHEKACPCCANSG